MVFLATGLFSVSAGAGAYALDPNEHVVGNYTGIVLIDGLPQPVLLSVEKLKLGQHGGQVNYTRPRNCRALLEYGGRVGDQHIFYGRNKGCDHLRDKGTVHFGMTKSADSGLVVDVVGSSAGLIESFTLYPE